MPAEAPEQAFETMAWAFSGNKKPPYQGFFPVFQRFVVGLFSSHANELRKAYRHLSTDTASSRPQATPGRQRKAQPQLSDEKISLIARASTSGNTVCELAAEYGCHRVTISAVLNRQGITLRRSSPNTEQIVEMISLYVAENSLAAVGDRLGFNATTIRTTLLKAGVATRDSHGRS